ncbi:MAG: DsrE family protein [bacterium]|nr:DsrE family protein [bacterium]
MKQVTTLIRESPFNAALPAEVLRMTLGLILSENKAQVILTEEGVNLLRSVSPARIGGQDVHRHLRTLAELGCPVIAEQESLDASGIGAPAIEVIAKSRREIANLLAESDYVLGV